MSPALPPTPGQTVGPFFGYALPYDGDRELVPPGHPRRGPAARHGHRRRRRTRCRTRCSRSGRPTPTGRSSRGPGSLRRDGYTFTGWGRAATDDTGHYTFTTRRARRRPTPGTAPFFAVTVFARGLLNRLFTRAYLPEDAAALAADPLLASLRRRTAGARWSRGPTSTGCVFDIRLQGERRDGLPALSGTLTA